jgi:hypothetical protein
MRGRQREDQHCKGESDNYSQTATQLHAITISLIHCVCVCVCDREERRECDISRETKFENKRVIKHLLVESRQGDKRGPEALQERTIKKTSTQMQVYTKSSPQMQVHKSDPSQGQALALSLIRHFRSRASNYRECGQPKMSAQSTPCMGCPDEPGCVFARNHKPLNRIVLRSCPVKICLDQLVCICGKFPWLCMVCSSAQGPPSATSAARKYSCMRIRNLGDHSGI